MAADQIARLFQPFAQGDSSTSRKFGGTGLGLVISKRLAEILGGDISVRSAPGEGSTFSLTVAAGPLDEVRMITDVAEAVNHTRPTSQPPDDAPVGLACRLLLAEDGPDNQRLISLLLRKAGAEVELAENGRIALDLALAARHEGRGFRPDFDGHANAGHGRLRSHSPAAGRRIHRADHRPDGPRHGGRSRTMSGGRLRRLYLEARGTHVRC